MNPKLFYYADDITLDSKRCNTTEDVYQNQDLLDGNVEDKEMTEDDLRLQQAQREFHSLRKNGDHSVGHCVVKDGVVQGYMRKCVQNNSSSFFLREKYPKRFFKCDFTKANLYIAHSEDDMNKNSSNIHKIPFSDFSSINDFKSEHELEVERNCHIRYSYGFVLQSSKRPFYLFCKSPEECNVWRKTFKYMVLSAQR